MKPNFSIDIARIGDIEQIVKIQSTRSLHAAVLNGASVEEIERNGFLVHVLSESEIIDLINRTEGIHFLVHRNCDTVTGYILGYKLGIWKELNPSWSHSIELKNNTDSTAISDNLSIYFRHVATLPNATEVNGTKLSRELIKIAKNLHYRNIIGEILKKPYTNIPSYKIHTYLGFEEIGENEETYNNKIYRWGLLRKDLSEPSLTR